jgi:hypothetical protein
MKRKFKNLNLCVVPLKKKPRHSPHKEDCNDGGANLRMRKGSLIAETMIALALLGTIMVIMALGLKTFGNFNKYLFAKQRCISAAQAQLDSISATGVPVSDDVNKRLWPQVKIQIEESDGSGQWQGLKLVKVKAVEQSGTKQAHIEMARYFTNGNQK